MFYRSFALAPNHYILLYQNECLTKVDEQKRALAISNTGTK